MEAKAKELGMEDTLTYIFPSNSGPNSADAPALADLGLGDRLVVDIHDGAKGGVERAESIFANNNTATW